MSTDLVKYYAGLGFDEVTVRTIKDQIAPTANDQELALFLTYAARTKLDPFSKQLYLIGRWNSNLRKEVQTTQISIDGARSVAERSGKYEGQIGPQWCGPDEIWKDVWLKKDYPCAARVGVLRTGFREPLWGIALWASYVQVKKDGSVTDMWHRFASLMLAKCAEMLALRKAFPMDLSGLYSSEEMSQADVIEAEPVRELPPAQSTPKEELEQPKTYTGSPSDKRALMDMCKKLGFVTTDMDWYKRINGSLIGEPLSEVFNIVSDVVELEIANQKQK
jgi:phage recombination protein Bet